MFQYSLPFDNLSVDARPSLPCGAINVQVLGSTSFGCATLIWSDSWRIMIDCGFSAQYIRQHLDSLSIDWSTLDGVFLTHLHGDHVKSSTLKKIVSLGVKVYCHTAMAKILCKSHAFLRDGVSKGLIVPFSRSPLAGHKFNVIPFAVPHDAKGGCFGFRIEAVGRKGIRTITIATDIGFVESSLVDYFRHSDVILIEANHDTHLLNSSDRPIWLKNRITKIGHLSNHQCGDFLNRVLAAADQFPVAIFLCHLSDECNTHDLATATVRQALANTGAKNIPLIATFRTKPSEIITLD